jgi:hypothetical protein
MHRIFSVAKPEDTFWRSKSTCEYNIKIDLKEFACDDLDWIHLSQGYSFVASSCQQGNDPLGSV